MATRSWKTTFLNVLVLVLLIGYTAVAVRYCSRREQELKCTGMEIRVQDSAEQHFVTPQLVRSWLRDSLEQATTGLPLREVDVYAAEKMVRQQPYVRKAEAYTAIDGLLHVKISQRTPLFRVVSEAGHNFYVDSALVILPPQSHCIAEVPVVSGKVPLGFPPGAFGPLDEKKYPQETELLHNLLNFVHQVDSSAFLKALVVQIYFDNDGEVLLLPRVGGESGGDHPALKQVVRFGQVVESQTMGVPSVQSRLKKLVRFYKQSFSEVWWKDAAEIDIQFRGQVVISKRTKRS